MRPVLTESIGPTNSSNPPSLDIMTTIDSPILTFAATFIGFAILVVGGGLYLARKIAGPIFALRRHLERVADGESVADLAFRKDDYFAALQIAFNRHMETYRKLLPSDTSYFPASANEDTEADCRSVRDESIADVQTSL